MKNKLNGSINKLIISVVLIITLLVLLFLSSIKIFTIATICVILVITLFKLGDSKMLSFLRSFGKTKAKHVATETRQLIARMDKEGYSEAVLDEMQTKLSEFGLELATTRKRVEKETAEYVEVQTLYDQRKSAALIIKADIDAGDTTKVESLTKLLDLLETTKINVDTEKQQAEFWNSHLSVIQKRYDDAANDLRNAKSKISQSMAKMEQAEIKNSQAELQAEASKRASGLSSSMGALDSALAALDDATLKAETKAEAAEIAADTFKSNDDDDVIKAAMQTVSGKGAKVSLDDRLANL